MEKNQRLMSFDPEKKWMGCFFYIFDPPPPQKNGGFQVEEGGGGCIGVQIVVGRILLLDKSMISQGVKHPLQPVIVGDVNTPKDTGMWGVPHKRACIALMCETLRGDCIASGTSTRQRIYPERCTLKSLANQ